MSAISDLRGYPARGKRARSRKRKAVGYDSREPEMCRNCSHFIPALHAKGEHFPPLCRLHDFAVEKHAVCDHWAPADEA